MLSLLIKEKETIYKEEEPPIRRFLIYTILVAAQQKSAWQ